ncbi:MAG: RluA family pseudouridine synthase [Lachnospiraceae bacterium]|nr:RluA family pseudouridine synthase [Lachnospiraceae bacterium]
MRILYEDQQILVCYKEAGLPVQSARIGTKDLVSILKNYLWEQGGESKEPYLGVIHRLDQPVEGILVFAKNPGAAGKLSAQVNNGTMKKIYRAVIHRAHKDIPEEGHLTDYLLKDGKTNSSRVVPRETRGAKRAELDYRIVHQRDGEDKALQPQDVLRQSGAPELVQIHLLTGRHHQIRVQMANAGMPLYGDRKYGEMDSEGSLALCAVSLQFLHPKTGKKMEFSCEPQGEYFKRFGTY